MYWIRCSWTRSKTSYAVVVEKKPPLTLYSMMSVSLTSIATTSATVPTPATALSTASTAAPGVQLLVEGPFQIFFSVFKS